MLNQFTTEQAQAIAAEINEWHKHDDKWTIRNIEHLYALPEECYHVRYMDGFSSVFMRNTFDGRLTPAPTYTYWSPDFKGFEQAGTSESERAE